MANNDIGKTQVKVINAVSVATEADVIAAPTSGKRYKLLSAKLAGDQAGVYDFQDSGTTTTRVAVYLAANVAQDFDFGQDGIDMAADKALSCDGPASSVLTGFFVVKETN